jgi:hypothetical protein
MSPRKSGGSAGWFDSLTQLVGSPLREQVADHSLTVNKCEGRLHERIGSNRWSCRTNLRAYVQ